MADSDDIKQLLEQKRFLDEIEQGIRIANREIIHNRIPKLTKKNILSFAVGVGRLRAKYLEEAMKLGEADDKDDVTEEVINKISLLRKQYEEARHGFDDLRWAIERGYVDVEGIGRKS